MKSGVVILLASFIFGIILIAVCLGLLFGLKWDDNTQNSEYTGTTGATGPQVFKFYDLCVYDVMDPGFSSYTYITKLPTSNTECDNSTSTFIYKDKLRVYYKKKEPTMDKFCIYDTGVATDLYKNTSIGLTEAAVVPGGNEQCPIYPSLGIRLIDTFYTNSSLDTTTTFIDASYNPYCSYGIADHPKPNGSLRSKTLLIKKTGQTCPDIQNYNKGPVFYFDKISQQP